jgi:hypothetical protein
LSQDPRAAYDVLHLNFESRRAGTLSVVGARVLAPPALLAREVRRLGLLIAVFGRPDREHYLDATLYLEATGHPGMPF